MIVEGSHNEALYREESVGNFHKMVCVVESMLADWTADWTN